MNRYAVLSVLVLLLGGCAVDPLEDRRTAGSGTDADSGNPEAIHAWMWAYADGPDSLSVFHTIDKQCWESFHVSFAPENGFHPAGLVGGGIYPTIWSWDGDKVYSLTNGILDHGDHGHIVHPQEHVILSVAPGCTIGDMSVSPDGSRIVVCGSDTGENTETGDVIAIQYKAGDTTRYSVEHAVSYVVGGNDRIFAGSTRSVTGVILQSEDGSLVATVATDTLVVDGVCHEATATVFLAGKEMLSVIDLRNACALDAIDYGGEGNRIIALLAARDGDYALGLCDPGSWASDHVLVVDMQDRALHRYSASGASFAHDMHNGTVVLSDDGTAAILSDLEQPVVYRISLADGTVEQTPAPDTACPVACNQDGSRVWALARSKVYQVSFERNTFVDSIDVPSQTTWIMVTSFKDNSSLFDSNDHTF